MMACTSCNLIIMFGGTTRMDKPKLTRGQFAVAAVVIIAWGVLFFAISFSASLAAAYGCGLAVALLDIHEEWLRVSSLVVLSGRRLNLR